MVIIITCIAVIIFVVTREREDYDNDENDW